MHIETENLDGGILKIKLVGRMDAQGAQEIHADLVDRACAQRSVIADMSAVNFLASMGIRALVLAAKAVARRHGKMVLLNPDVNTTKVLEVAGVNELLPIHRSLDDAIRAVAI
jgi:anti-anti-sigma factor